MVGSALSSRVFLGYGHTSAAMAELGVALAAIFRSIGVPVVPIQTSASVRIEKGAVKILNTSIITDVLKRGGVPLMGGDVAIEDARQSTVVSADKLASSLSALFANPHVLHATNVAGVYRVFPPKKNEKPIARMNRTDLRTHLKNSHPENCRRDVTGAMSGKLASLLHMKKGRAYIFDGRNKDALQDACGAQERGTQVIL